MATPAELLALYANPTVNTNTPADPSSLVQQPTSPAELIPTIMPEMSSGISAQKMQGLLTTSEDKQSQVANASADKRSALSGQDYYNIAAGRLNDAGMESATGIEADIRTMDPLSLLTKYGPDEFNRIVHGTTLGNSQVRRDAQARQTGGDAIVDTGLGIAQGLTNAVGGIGALGAGLINPELGVAGSELLEDLNNTISGWQSDGLNARRNVYQAKQAQDSRDHKLELDNSDGGLIDGLARIGKDAMSAVSNATDDISVVGDGIAQGVGSILAAGPIGRGVRAVAENIPGLAGRLSTTGATSAGIGLMEGGGAYQQSAAEINKTPFADLAKQSPEFVEMINSGMEPEKARARLANRAALLSAAIQAPAAAVIGRIAAGFEANPFAIVSPRVALQNSAKEMVEEGLQGTTGQLAQNIGAQVEAGSTKDITEGVGEQTGLGALYGLGAAGVMQGPATVAGGVQSLTGDQGVIAKGVANSVDAVQKAAAAVKSAAAPGIDWLAKRGDEAYRKMQESSPVSDTNINVAARDVQENAAATAEVAKEGVVNSEMSPEDKQAATDFIDTLTASMEYDPSEFEAAPDYWKNIVDGSRNKIDALTRIATFVADEKNPAQERFALAGYLNDNINGFSGYIDSNSAALNSLPADHVANQFAAGISDLFAAVQKSQSVSKAQQAMESMAENAKAHGIVQPVDESTITTPEGQQNVQNQANLAAINPLAIDPVDAEIILKQERDGAITLSPKQSAALNTAVSLVRSAQDFHARAKEEGWKPSGDNKTGFEIEVNPDTTTSGKESVVSHARSIYSAYASGDTDLARERLNRLMQFAVHMQGKVATINQHISTPNPNSNNNLNYPQLRTDGTWGTSKEKIGVTPTSPNSVSFARRVTGEARLVTQVANNLAEAFSDLGVAPINHTDLDTRLSEGSPEDAAKAFREGVRKPGTSVNSDTQTVVAESTPTQPVEGDQATDQANNPAQTEQSDNTFTVGEDIIWANKDHDIPVVYRGNDEIGPDGKTYSVVFQDGRLAYLPKDELRKVQKPAVTEMVSETDPVQEIIDDAEPANFAEIDKAIAEENAVQESVTQKETVPEKVEPTTVAEAYSKLTAPDGKNYLTEAFKLPKSKRSRTQGVTNPLAELNSAFTSAKTFTSFSGSKSKNTLTPELAETYRDLMAYGRNLVKQMNVILNQDIDKQITSGNGFLVPTNSKALKSNQGKSFNIVEVLTNGRSRYNPELIQNSVLAGLQWALTANDRLANMNVEDISKVLGIEPDAVTDEMVDQFNTSITRVEAQRAIADKITQYWGLSANQDYYAGFTQGIPLSVAGEILRALEQDGMVKLNTVTYGVTNLTDDGIVSVDRKLDFVRTQLPSESMDLIRDFPNAIDLAVLTEPEERVFTGDQRPPVAKTQMGNKAVQNTDQQKEVLKNVQNTAYRLHMPMVNFFNAIGMEGVRDLFGAGDLSRQVLNVNDKRGKEGRNLSFTQAFEQLQNLQRELENRLIDDETGDIAQTDIFYQNNFSSVNRLQMLGAYNPQASKFMREAVLPTSLGIDTTDPKIRTGFFLALAQALDIKIHNQAHAVSVQQVSDRLAGEYAPAVQMFSDFHATDMLDDNAVQILLDAGLTSPVAVQAVSEYARYLAADQTNFQTPMYVEADGVTNGIANATQMLSSGPFDTRYIHNSNRTGLFFGSDATNLNDFRQNIDGSDMYISTASSLTEVMDTTANVLRQYPEVNDQFSMMKILMGILLPGAKLAADGKTLTYDRKITKNPMTITLYGSSEFGIAGNIADTMVSELYSLMSKAAAIQSQFPDMSMGEAMFGPEGDAKFAALQESINALTRHKAVYKKSDGTYLLLPSDVEAGKYGSAEEFTLSSSEVNSLRTNMFTMFVKPMTEAITENVGASVMQNMGNVRVAAQVISIFQEAAFQQLVNSHVAQHKEKDPNYAAHFLLSQKEQDAILKSVLEIYPTINTGSQTFFIGGSNNALDTNSPIGQSRDGKNRMPGRLYGPTDAGVAGAAYLNIGMGDGMMIQDGFSGTAPVQHALHVFDGVNLRIDRLDQDSQKLNNSVFKSWQQNPVKEVLKSLNTTIKNMDRIEMSDEILDKLARAFFGTAGAKQIIMTPDLTKQMMAEVAEVMRVSSISIDARHATLRQFNLNVDQMASMAAPYTNKGEQLPADQGAAVARLNEVYAQEFKRLAAKAQNVKVPKTKPKQEGKPVTAGVPSSGSARVISMTGLDKLVKGMKLSPTKQAMFDEIRRSGAAKGYKIVTGTREQLMAYNEANGMKHDQSVFTSDTVDGFISPQNKEIFIVNATAQTLLHEMIHAASFETILAHYEGTTTNEINQSVTALEGMMDQFLNLPFETFTTQRSRDDYQNAVVAINGALSNQDMDAASSKAIALNEFMAWSLATQNLSDALAKQPLIKRITDAVVEAIRKLVYGRKRVPAKPGDDILSNLQFHTGVIIRGQATANKSFRDTMLYQNSTYGNNDRLAQINQTFSDAVTQYLNNPSDMTVRATRRTEAAESAIASQEVANAFINSGFNMNMQEATTFTGILYGLGTQAYIDPPSMNYAQEMYEHVTSQLTIGHFLPDNFTQQDEYDATQKFNAIMGRNIQRSDRLGRSSLVPAFLALAMVNDEFRNVLSTIGLPENQKGEDTLDGRLESFGNNMLDNLGRRMAGTDKSLTVLGAMDALTNRITDLAQNRETFIDQYAETTGSALDRANEIVSEKLASASEKIWDTADNVKAKTSNKFVHGLANATQMFAAIANETMASKVSEAVSATITRMDGKKALTDIISDIVGRTDSNKNLYDLIKRFRAAIQQDRQQFRDHLPTVIANKFTRELTNDEWSLLHKGLATTDLVSLVDHFTSQEVNDMFADGRTLRGKITAYENRIQNVDPKHAKLYLRKAQQLAYYMMGGEPGTNLLRNADAISALLGESTRPVSQTAQFTKDIDALVTLYAVEQMSREERLAISSLVQDQPEGMDFTMAYLKGQRAEEQKKLLDNPAARFNGYKGYVPTENDAGVTLIVANVGEHAKLKSMSLEDVGRYVPSSAEPHREPRAYYFGNVQSRTMFNQGLMQNVRQSANGVDVSNGFTMNKMTAGRITDRATVKSITARLRNGETGSSLMPVYNERGVVIAYERSIDPVMLNKLNQNKNLAQMLGNWRGRQVEEVKAEVYNQVLIDTLYDMYVADLKRDPKNSEMYINVNDVDLLDPVLADAIKLMPRAIRRYAEQKFNGDFYVRKDMLNDTFGYRDATIGDAWTGNARWSPETLTTARRVAMGMFGADAYRYFTNGERMLQNFVQDARTLIIVKSVIVPFANGMSNVLQLVGRGVPMRHIVSGVPRKVAEINSYIKTRTKILDAEAELRSVENNVVESRKLQTQIQAWNDSIRRLSIWPLLEAGEFSAITDASLNSEDIDLSSGKLNSYIEQQVSKLPKAVQTAGRYALVTKDTALFKALEKSVAYGDFVAKAILFDDIVRRQKKPVQQALAAITEEFINYERLPGRFRGYMEKTGLLWFYNYKVRAVKVALSTIRNNPVHALFAGALPMPEMFGSVGSPITDNLVTQFADGGLGHSVGMGQAFNAPFLNPWVNLIH